MRSILKKLLLLFFYLTISDLAIAQTSQIKVIAIGGDGIYSILRKNGLEPTKHYRAFIKLNKENLTVNNGVLKGRTYILPTIEKDTIGNNETPSITDKIESKIIEKPNDNLLPKKQINDPLFGKDYDVVPLESSNLNGAIYYLISGHGGPDPGAIETYNGKLISEDEYAYDVTLRLARRLISNGAKVYIIIKDENDGIRDKKILEVDYDEVNYPDKPISKSQKLRLRQRTKTVNNLYLKHKGAYQRLIVTHVDSRSKSKNIDVFFYHHHNSKSGKQLAKNIHKSFKEKYAKHQPNRIYSGSVKSRGLYLIKNTLPAMVYIELGNIKNKKDQKRILNYENRKALAKWVFNGVLADYNESKSLH
ncbi:N-acetylmuramoyl-L-alanine amidase family protein [Flavivirga spongiicola]|uniref:N-acetylmuramoyl-L-alanine amidase n=1 Tax=Flavivirga spongiicola TaxID=421621 RepID=A0ABU7XRH9_9FLAO|nr:N-acetylmuramoyl-L-alanine amidase [Flavivirga sp. MEBiC05379]MDO5978033.1 N-acetylmuramoyl-L-alanine amidase [Flavivirga sp. MEBiC05379]